MLVVGGGVVGCEFASLFAPLGTKITVVEILPRLLLGIDNRTASQFQRLLEKDGVEVRLGRQVAEITEYRDDGVTVRLDDDTEVSAEKLLVSVGRRSQAAGIGLEEIGVEITERGHVVVDEYLRTANPRVWAAGDCIGGLQLAHLASAEAARAVENAVGGRDGAHRPHRRAELHLHPPRDRDRRPERRRRQGGAATRSRSARPASAARARRSARASPTATPSSSWTPRPGSCWARRSWASTRSR